MMLVELLLGFKIFVLSICNHSNILSVFSNTHSKVFKSTSSKTLVLEPSVQSENKTKISHGYNYRSKFCKREILLSTVNRSSKREVEENEGLRIYLNGLFYLFFDQKLQNL